MAEQSKKPRSNGWGGRREGAGAPKGNKNAWKHGRYSMEYKLLLEIFREERELAQRILEYR